MKTINFLIALLIMFLFTTLSFAQTKITRGFSVVEDFGTVTNSGQETAYLDLRGWKTVDSVSVALVAVNETDVDTINFYPGVYTGDGFKPDAAASVLYQAVTINIADGSTDVENLVTADATKLTGVALRGFNGVKAVIEIAAAGNDATDPNALYIHWRIWGTK